MICEQHYLACLAQASYLLVDERTHTAIVVDPRRDVEVYLERAQQLGAQIRFVLLTHFHADFAAGHLELARRTGATICMGSVARASFKHRGLANGEELTLGDVRVRCLHTPGHTPESVSYLVFDDKHGAVVPYAVLTGDTLFVGDVGRPDLLSSVGVTAEELAGRLFESLHGQLMTLPDNTRLMPGHGPGSMCGRALGSETTSTIGAQRTNNYALAPMTKAQFVALVSNDQPQAPAYFAFDARFNSREHETLDVVLERALVPLARDAVRASVRDGAQVLDVRDAETFARGHLPGSVNVGLEGKFATWAGAVLDSARPIILVVPLGKEREAALRLGRIGFDRVVGYLAGGAESLAGAPDLARYERFDPPQLTARLARGDFVLLDVRTPTEWETLHVRGAIHVPLVQLPARVAEIPRGVELVVVCAAGYRSAVATSWLRASGFAHVGDVRGGMGAVTTQPSGLPLESAAAAGSSSCG